jgi:hypothetical protein
VTNLPQDCSGSSVICLAQNNRNFIGTNGCTQDLGNLNRGCLGNERQGMWYTFSPPLAGTFECTITPTDQFGNPTTADLDFAIWDTGMQLTCPPSSAPIRCSFAKPGNAGPNIGAGTYLTGMRVGETDTSEPSYNGVNGFVAPLVVPEHHVGRIYVLYIDNFSMTGGSFQLDWTFSNGSHLGCSVLPVELVSFEAGTEAGRVRLDWATMSEHASDRFVIERSANGEHFTDIGSMAAAGNSQQRIEYRWIDNDPLSTLAYYRLRQVDEDGTEKLSHVVTAEPQGYSGILSVHPNPAHEQLIIGLPDLSGGGATATLFDQSGRLMRHWDVPAGPAREFRIPLHDVERGSYLLQLVGRQGGVSMARFIRQ